jgi:hypothetical protein
MSLESTELTADIKLFNIVEKNRDCKGAIPNDPTTWGVLYTV